MLVDWRRHARARRASGCGGAMIFAAAAIVTAEVLLRKGLGAPVGTGFVFSGSDEISAFLFAVGTSWSLAHVLVTRGHVRIDALYTYFGPRTARDPRSLRAARARHLSSPHCSSGPGMSPPPATSTKSAPTRRSACRWPGRKSPGLPASPCSFSPWCWRSFAPLGALLRGDYAAAAAIAGAASQDEEIESELEGLGIHARSGSGAGDRR